MLSAEVINSFPYVSEILRAKNSEDLKGPLISIEFFSGINKTKQMELFRILAGILHMGNVQFKEEDGETCSIPVSIRSFAPVFQQHNIFTRTQSS